MNKGNDLPKRKSLRIKKYDYSSKGAYFITICIKDRQRILSKIVKDTVGGGAHDAPQIHLTEIGKIIERNLLSSENIPGVSIDRYVIMPDHIHVIIILDPEKYSLRNGSSRAPTPTNEMLPHIISTFKRFCGREIGNNVFQRGYIEHIVRDREDYDTRVKYIHYNPIRWYFDKLNENS